MNGKLSDFTKGIIQRFLDTFILIIALILIASSVRSIVRIRKAGGELFKVEEEVEKIEFENQELRMRLDESQSNEYIEKQLRDKLGLARDDEVVVILPSEEVIRKFAPIRQEEQETLPEPNWKRWVNLFI